MYAFFLVIHVLAAVLLVSVILIQRGRGGGLVESMSGMESMFGAKTSQFLTRATTIFACVFMCTSVILAVIAARQSRSLINEAEVKESTAEEPIAEESTDTQTPPAAEEEVTSATTVPAEADQKETLVE